uniref:Non-specific lipid-transfer protein n=1 Tax=Phaseolus vulgaris TaxID=3885 RepID=O24440_PHAVU|nr:non-specific lipid transfer protein PvLTP-24 [Phaseolus vulgaris]
MATLNSACVVAVLCLVVLTAPTAHAAISCGQVTSSLASCIPFLTKGGAVPASCCSGVRSLNAAAKTTPDRQVCNCLKSAAGAIPGFNANNAGILPGKCGVSIHYNISTSTNCATIKF